jgi:DNA (cytosine-5)-methyltransferase 1
MLRGLVIDNFAGGGGASTGIEAALGRAIDVAINHDAEAVAMHEANHPGTHHYCQSVWKADPREVVAEHGGGPVALAWFSPDCKHFSKAKGGKPVEKNIRDLAWVVVTWAQRVRPLMIMLENVEEFRTWGPLGPDGKPVPLGGARPATLPLDLGCAEKLDRPALKRAKKPARRPTGETFELWVAALRKLGYRVEDRELKACDYGAPTSRKRLFIVARCDGEPIVWPAPTHGKPGSPDVVSGRLKPWRTAAEIIDWSIPCPSIFERARPLKDATCRRIAHGIMRFVVNNPRPFIVPITHSGGDSRVHSPDEPVRTVTTASRGELAIVAPHVTKFRGGAIGHAVDEPLHTVTANSFIKRPGGATPLGLVTATLQAPLFARTAHGERDRSGKGDHGPEDSFPTVLATRDSALIAVTIVGCGGRRGQSGPVDPQGPYPVTTAKADACLVTAYMAQHNGGKVGHPLPSPVSTLTASGRQQQLVAVTLVKNNFGPNPAQAVTVPLHTATTQANKFGLLAAMLIQLSYGERQGQSPRVLDLNLPCGTAVAGGCKQGLVTAFLAKFASGNAPTGADNPVQTVEGRAKHSLVCAHIEQANTGMIGHPIERPLSTIVGKGCTQRLAATSLVKLRGTSRDGQPVDEPLHTVSAGGTHFAEVSAFLVKYYGNEDSGHRVDQPLHTAPTKDRFGLVTVTIHGEEYVIADIGMRMLTPRELARAQGFPDSYVLDPVVNGKPLTKTAQIRMIGNSVCPPMAEALVRANAGTAEAEQEAA